MPPTNLFYHGQVQNFQKEGGHHILTMTLPFIKKGDISLTQNGDELLIRVENFKRNISLPRSFSRFSC